MSDKIRTETQQGDEGIKVVDAQHLYDLRELTGFVSGTDLHDLFREVLDGEPSPSGRVTIDTARLEKSPSGKEALKMLSGPVWKVVPAMAKYTGMRGDFEGDESMVDLEKGTVKAQLLYDIRGLTGFISGAKLHDLFREVLDGEPSPSGYTDVSIEKLSGTNLGVEALEVLNRPTSEALTTVREYVGE